MFIYCPQLDTRMDLNVDITIAMPCRRNLIYKIHLVLKILLSLHPHILVVIGADVLDTTGQNVLSFGHLKEEDTWFELSPHQRKHFVKAQQLNGMLREKAHGMQQLLWKGGYETIFGDIPAR